MKRRHWRIDGGHRVHANIIAAWERADDNAPWIVWGSGMSSPDVAQGYIDGKPVVMDDMRVIAVRRTLGR